MNEVAETKFQVASFVIHQQQRVSSISVRKTVLISIALLVFFLGTRKCVGRWWCIISPLLQCARKRDLETDWQEICNHKTRYPEKKGKKGIYKFGAHAFAIFSDLPLFAPCKIAILRLRTTQNSQKPSSFLLRNLTGQCEQAERTNPLPKTVPSTLVCRYRRRGRRSQGRKRKKRKISLVQNIYEKEGKKCPLGYR